MRGKFLLGITLLAVGVTLLGGCKRSVTVQNGSEDAGAGKVAPEASVAIPTLNDVTVSIGQYKGKVVLVNFWATWCEPCKKEIPWLIKLNEQYSSRGLVILGISMDDEGKKKVEPFVTTRTFDVDGKPELMNYQILLGNDEISEKFGGLMGLPTSMFYARDGQKVKTIIGAVNSYEDLTKAIDKQL
jgi:thiol-disulfide isomerase/thioredoxin